MLLTGQRESQQKISLASMGFDDVESKKGRDSLVAVAEHADDDEHEERRSNTKFLPTETNDDSF